MAVFNSGILKGFKTIIEYGGQISPMFQIGETLPWKIIQNQLKKNMTSLKIKNPTPSFKPS